MTNDIDNKYLLNAQDSIDVIKKINILWNRKFFIFSITSILSILSIIIALYIPNIYQSKAILAPVNNEGSNPLSASRYGAVASMAGISLSSESGDLSVEAIERIGSYQFFVNQFLPFIKIEDLMAAWKWDPETNKIIYKTKLFNATNNKWKDESLIPSSQEAYKTYKEIISISRDQKTNFVTITIQHVSPLVAKEWLSKIILEINESMKIQEREKVIKSIDFLNAQMEVANYSEIKEAISYLLKEQMQTQMRVESSDDFIFSYIESPIAPERKFKPSRSLICVMGFFIGLIISILYVLITYLIKENHSERN